MSRSDERTVALRFCLTALGGLLLAFAWVSVLSFSPADPPSTSVWPANDPPTNLCGATGAWLAYQLWYYLGIGTFALLGLLTLALLAWHRRVPLSDPWLRFAGATLVCTAIAAAGTFVAPTDHHLITGPGGVLGATAGALLMNTLQTTGTLLVLLGALLVGLLLAADELMVRIGRWLRWAGPESARMIAHSGSSAIQAGANGVSSLAERLRTEHKPNAAPAPATPPPPDAGIDDEQLAINRTEQPLLFASDEKPEGEATEIGDETADAPAPAAKSNTPPTPAKSAAVPERVDANVVVKEFPSSGGSRPPSRSKATYTRPEDDDYEMPEVTVLDEASPIDREAIEYLCREKALTLEKTLNEFRLEVQVVAIETGPVITVFELRLSPGIKVSQINSLTNDMARALKAPAVRVVAPLPGKSTIGIEVPNIDKEKVRLRDIMEKFGARGDSLAIPLYLGKDASGQPLVADLTRMPHMLIAGTTGSGKSVCIASIIMSILMTRSPEQVKLIMVDPKVVELSMFKDIPHLMCPIITEMSKAEAILDWAATKMDERYALLAEAGVKDIRSYNRLGFEGLKERLEITDDAEMAQIPAYLPYIVIVIDELADLMMTSAKEVEFYLCRLAQKSRAVGIHLIVSTQRPSANVVTGLIKSNLPCRIAFRVASRLDSRIVLDQNGGEVLMGQGDMLYLPPGSSKLVRAQGTFIDDSELRAVVNHTRSQCEQRFHPELTRTPNVGADSDGERDELFDQAVEVIVEAGRGSVSLLQRRLTVGYGRAARLIEQMHAAGIVGDYKSGQAREVVVTKDEWAAIKAQRDREEADESARA